MSKFGSFLRDAMTPLVVLILAGVVAYDHLGPHSPAPVPGQIDARELGRKFAATMPATFAEGWLAAASTLEAGKPMADALAALQTTWQAGRTKAFETQVATEFAKVLPEGTEPAGPIQRATVVQLYRDFATGLKGGR